MLRTRFSFILGGLLSWAALSGAEPKWTLRTVPSQPNPPPIPSIADSPVKYLSDLLAATPERREKMLASKTKDRKAFWARKIGEYEQLPESVRQDRLKVAQLHWYIALLIPISADAREKRLKQIPDGERDIVQQCLERWDKLSEDARADVMNNFKLTRYFARGETRSSLPPPLPPASIRPGNLKNPSAQTWESSPLERRREMLDAYARFYELPARQQEATLEKMPFPFRKECESQRNELLQMPPDQRQRTLNFLRAFAKMSPEEQARFRENAKRWRDMNSQERNFWMRYVKQLPKQLPPMPPGVESPGRPTPRN